MAEGGNLPSPRFHPGKIEQIKNWYILLPTRRRVVWSFLGIASLVAVGSFFLSQFTQARPPLGLTYSRFMLVGLGTVLFLMLSIVTVQAFKRRWAALIVAAGTSFSLMLALDWWAPKPSPIGFCYLEASVVVGTNMLTFTLWNNTDHPVKEAQIVLTDDGGVAHYLKNLKPGEHFTESGMAAAGQTISVGPIPTVIPHTVREITAFRKDISGRNRLAFSVNIATDSHLFYETIKIWRHPNGRDFPMQEILTMRDPKGDTVLWRGAMEAVFPKDFVPE